MNNIVKNNEYIKIFNKYNNINDFQKIKNDKNKNQIFKYLIPNKLLYDFFILNCETNNNNFIFNKESYKRSILNKSLYHFLQIVKPFYHNSKQYYVERCNSYKNFVTILRQLFKVKKINFENKVRYFRSLHEIEYYIYDLQP